MSTEQNKTIARRLYDEVFTHTGREGVRQIVSAFRRAFPDLTFEVHDVIAEGDKVVARVTIHGTHQGELMGIPPTGKRASVGAIDIMRVEGGKLAEHWGVTDNLAMMQQLGVIPMPGEAPA
jgi:steroid delta-isomerase-like uncharacterized protein